jgi:hypothetical protein
LKIFVETLLRIPFSVIGGRSLVPTSHWLQGKCARINWSQAASGKILQNSQAASCSISSEISALGSVFEAGYWKDIQN